MNSVQRKFLIDKLTERTKEKIRALNDSKPESVNLNVYLLSRVLSNNFQIKSNEELRQIIYDKALKAGQTKQVREDWLGNTWGSASKGNVSFELEEFFVVPEEYLEMKRVRWEAIQKIQKEIDELNLQLATLEVRIMVASDKSLDKLVQEVDDLGDIKLVDTRIKLIN